MITVTQPSRRNAAFAPAARLAPLRVALCALLIAGCTTGGPQGVGDRAGRQAPAATPADATVGTVMALAERTRANGDYSSAIMFYRRAILLDPFLTKAYLGLGESLLAAGYPNEAAESFRTFLDQAPKDKAINDAPGLRGLGMALIALGQPTAAIETLNKSIVAEPSPRAFSALGIAEDLVGDTAAADAAYKRGLVLAPDDLDLLNNYGLSQALHGDFNGAVNTLRRVASDGRASARHRANLALALGLAGRNEDAAQVARIDLDERSIKSNLAYYAELRALSPQARAGAILRPNTPLIPRLAGTSCDAPPCPSPALPGEKLSAAPQTPVDAKPLASPPAKAKPLPLAPPAAAKPATGQAEPAETKPAPAAKAMTSDAASDPAKPEAAKDSAKPSAPVQLLPQAAPQQSATTEDRVAPKAETPKVTPSNDATRSNTQTELSKPEPEAAKNDQATLPADPQRAAASNDAKAAPDEVAEPATPSTDTNKTLASDATQSDVPATTEPTPATNVRAPSGPVVKAAMVTPLPPGKHAWIQIASFRSEQNAHSAWKSMTDGNQDLLSYVPLSVRRVDLGADKGTYYVLRIGPLASTDQARELCSALKDRKIDCVLAK